MAQPPAAPGNHIERIDRQTSYNSNTSQSISNTTYTDVETITNCNNSNSNNNNNSNSNNKDSNNETNTISGKGTQITNSGEGDFTGDVDASSNDKITQEEKDRPLKPLPLSRISAAAQLDCFSSYICDVHVRGGISDLAELLGTHYVTFNFASKEYIRMQANQCDQNRSLNNYTKNKLLDLSYFDGYCNNLSIQFVWLTDTGSRWGRVTVLPVFGGQLDRAMKELCDNGFKAEDARFDVKNSSAVFKWFNSNDSGLYTGKFCDKDGNEHSSLPLVPDAPDQAFPLAPSKPILPWVTGFLYKNGNKDGNNNDNDNDNKEDSGKGVGLADIEYNDNSNENSNGRHGSHGGRRVNVPKRGSSLLKPNRKPARWRHQNGANHSRDKKAPKTSKAKQEQRDSPLGNGKKGKSFKKTGKPKPKSKSKSKPRLKSKSKSKKSGNNGAMSTAESPAQSESESQSHSESADVNEEEED